MGCPQKTLSSFLCPPGPVGTALRDGHLQSLTDSSQGHLVISGINFLYRQVCVEARWQACCLSRV